MYLLTIPLESLPELFGFCFPEFFGKTLGNKTWQGIVNEDLSYVSQIFLPKMMGNDPMPCSFVDMIAPLVCRNVIFHKNKYYKWHLHTD